MLLYDLKSLAPVLMFRVVLFIFLSLYIFFILYLTARRLPRAQPAQQPAGMVLSDRPVERSTTSACCS